MTCCWSFELPHWWCGMIIQSVASAADCAVKSLNSSSMLRCIRCSVVMVRYHWTCFNIKYVTDTTLYSTFRIDGAVSLNMRLHWTCYWCYGIIRRSALMVRYHWTCGFIEHVTDATVSFDVPQGWCGIIWIVAIVECHSTCWWSCRVDQHDSDGTVSLSWGRLCCYFKIKSVL